MLELEPFPRDVGASMEDIVTSMATNLEESIESQIISEVHHEQQKGAHR
jgi:hypothetical protein